MRQGLKNTAGFIIYFMCFMYITIKHYLEDDKGKHG